MNNPLHHAPAPIFDQFDHCPDPFAHPCPQIPDYLPPLAHSHYADDYWYGLRFIQSYDGSDATMNAYRRELERLLQWSWLIRQASVMTLKREDIEQFIRFCQNPPAAWIGVKHCPRFINSAASIRQTHPDWRPFVATISKTQTRSGRQPDPKRYSVSQASLRNMFAILSSFYRYLQQEEAINSNPVALIRQKSKFLTTPQRREVRRLSPLQWDFVLETVKMLADEEPDKHERSLFIMQCLYAMYVRISELVSDARHTPKMSDFHRDSDGSWWFDVIGKGNKERSISVSDAMLDALRRYRSHLGLTPLPAPGETTPLIMTMRGHQPVTSTRQIRNLVQYCFDQAVTRMMASGLTDESQQLQAATVHWLRHTGISEDVRRRPLDHVRDDAGHASSLTTDRYVDAERRARHASARNKPMNSDA